MDTPEITQQVDKKPVSLNEALGDEWETLNAASEDDSETPVVAVEEIEVDEVEIEPGKKSKDEEDVVETVKADEEVDEEIVDEEPVYDEPAPERWTQEMKDAYAALPAEAKEMMVEKVFKPMQRKYTESTTDLANRSKNIQPLLEQMDQSRGDFERAGQDPAEALRSQMAWATHFARVGPEQGLRDMAASYGVNSKETDGQDQDEYMTPVERMLKSRLDRVEQGFNQAGNRETEHANTQQREAHEARINQVKGDLKQFIDEQKDGKPAHPYVEKVAPMLAGFMKSEMVKKTDEYGQPIPFKTQLSQAYAMACIQDPSIRAAGTTGKKQKQVDRAKAASDVDVVTTTPAVETIKVPSKPLSVDLEEEWDRLASQ